MAKRDTTSWVKLYRGITGNPLWFSEPFTKAQAWVDLILIANREGIVTTSYAYLTERWNWSSKSKTFDFLKYLEKEGMIEFDRTQIRTRNRTQGRTQFSLINWAKFQSVRTQERTQSRTQDRTETESLLISSNNKNVITRNIKQEPLKPPKRKSRFLSVNGEMSHELGDTNWMEIDFSKEDENEKDLL